MKVKNLLGLAVACGVGAYIVNRYRNLEPREETNVEKKLITLEIKDNDLNEEEVDLNQVV